MVEWGLSSSEDGGIGRNPSLPCTTKRRITTNLKSINNQKHQKIKLHGTLTTKELKKQSTRTTRPVRQWMERTQCKVVDHAGRADLKENWDSELTVDYGGCTVGKTPSLTPEFLGKWVRDEQGSCIVSSLAPPPQAAQQGGLSCLGDR